MHKREPDRQYPAAGLDMEATEPDPMKVTMSMPVLKPPMPPRTEQLAERQDQTLEQMLHCHLVVTEGRDAGRTFVPTTECLVIGEHPSADVVLKDPAVSRFHCEITLGQNASVRDLGSQNGTGVNGVRWRRRRSRTAPSSPSGTPSCASSARAERPRIPLSGRDRFGQVVGRSAAMRAVFAALRAGRRQRRHRAHRGRDRHRQGGAAESIHRESAAGTAPSSSSTAAPSRPQLLESELFGHERGAFTGAVAQPQAAPSRPPRAAPSSSTRLASCPWSCSPSCCACSSGARSSGWAATATPPSTCGCWPPPTATCARR